jgi:hypothetical protein
MIGNFLAQIGSKEEISQQTKLNSKKLEKADSAFFTEQNLI